MYISDPNVDGYIGCSDSEHCKGWHCHPSECQGMHRASNGRAHLPLTTPITPPTQEILCSAELFSPQSSVRGSTHKDIVAGLLQSGRNFTINENDTTRGLCWYLIAWISLVLSSSSHSCAQSYPEPPHNPTSSWGTTSHSEYRWMGLWYNQPWKDIIQPVSALLLCPVHRRC